MSVGLDHLVEDFELDSLAYYHRGLDGEVHERFGAGMILGASLLTAAGVPACGEYELRTSLAMLVWTGSALVGRSPKCRLSISAIAWSRWATTAPPIWRLASTGRYYAGWAFSTASAAGGFRSSSMLSTGR